MTLKTYHTLFVSQSHLRKFYKLLQIQDTTYTYKYIDKAFEIYKTRRQGKELGTLPLNMKYNLTIVAHNVVLWWSAFATKNGYLVCSVSLRRPFENSALEELCFYIAIPNMLNTKLLQQKPSPSSTLSPAFVPALEFRISTHSNPRFKLFSCIQNFVLQNMPIGTQNISGILVYIRSPESIKNQASVKTELKVFLFFREGGDNLQNS